jgi:DNA uptake protein ComE-like DNA-binding protein
MRVRLGWVVLGLSVVLVVAAAQTVKRGQRAPAYATTTLQRGHTVDINRASKQQLLQLPGVGPVMVQKIIAGRPFKTTHQLVEQRILPPSVYQHISRRIVAKP